MRSGIEIYIYIIYTCSLFSSHSSVKEELYVNNIVYYFRDFSRDLLKILLKYFLKLESFIIDFHNNSPVIYLEKVGLMEISSTIPIVPYFDFPLQGNDCPATKINNKFETI